MCSRQSLLMWCGGILLALAVGSAIGARFPSLWPFGGPSATTPTKGSGPTTKVDGAVDRAVELSKEWTYDPNPRPPSYGSSTQRPSETLVIVTIQIEDTNFKGRGVSGKEWFRRASQFYA